MEPELVETRSLPELVPAPVNIAWLDRRADGRGEHEPVLTPRCAECKTLSVLPLAVLAQVPDRGARSSAWKPQQVTGALPPNPRPSLGDERSGGHPLAGQASPTPEPPGPLGLAALGLRQTLAAPENPAQPQGCPTEGMTSQAVGPTAD